ncbi:hypothetical protein ACNOYE_39875 [Nannocystaceae bacterium ST9]
MPMLPLAFVVVAVLVPTVLHRWEHARISPHLPRKPWAHGVWAIVLALILCFVGALFVLSIARGHVANLVPLALIVLLLFPWPITRAVLIPLGAWRAAWNLTQLAGWVWRGDVAGGQFVAGTWALLRRRVPEAGAIAWLSARRDELTTLEGAGVLGSALLADALGDREQARRLMRSVADFDDDHCPPITRHLANEWRIADAAARGDWTEVEQLGRSPQRRSRAARLLGAIAARLIGYPPVPGAFALIGLWLLAPSRVRHFGLLRRALITPIEPEAIKPTTRTSTVATIEPDALLATHARTLVSSRVGTAQILALASAWDRALAEPGLREQTVRRALALRGGDPDQVLAKLGRQVERDLAELARGARIPLATLEQAEGSLRRVARELRHELLDDLALACEALDRRVRARKPLPALDELREFLAVQELYERVHRLGGGELLRVAFSQAHDPLCNLAVWLWDERGETAIANAMFRWLLHEATVVGDEEAVVLQRRNVACG